MNRFLILGAGRQGSAVAAFLLEQLADTAIDFVDNDAGRLRAAAALQQDAKRVACHELNVHPIPERLEDLMTHAACVVSCVPYYLNVELTAAAIEAGTPFCDLGGNIGTVQRQLAMADKCASAGVAIAPDCGLAPGLLNILAEYWTGTWTYQSVRLYCGGLPQNPRGQLKYALTFNVCGLLNEYLDDCEVSRGGELVTVPGMSEVERLADLAIPGEFEAFATSGGASLGARLYARRNVDYQYKTIRYPGHAAVINSMWEMGFFDTEPTAIPDGKEQVQLVPRDVSAAIMARSLVSDGKDLVVARAEVNGEQEGEKVSGRIDLIDYAVDRFTAMERTTGFPTAITAAALAGLYDGCEIEPGAYAPFQIIPPTLMIDELARTGVTGISVRKVN